MLMAKSASKTLNLMAYVLEQNNLPFEYYENIDGGHSASANLKEAAKRAALEYTFLAQTLMD